MIMAYRERLTRWLVVRCLPGRHPVVVGRFRSRSDADGHQAFLSRQMPAEEFTVMFEKHVAGDRTREIEVF